MRRWMVGILGLAIIAFAVTFFGRPMLERQGARRELGRSASNFCACVIGKPTSDVQGRMDGIGFSVAMGADKGLGVWPLRCIDQYRSAYSDYERARQLGVVSAELPSADKVKDQLDRNGAGALTDVVQALRQYWDGDPDPSVPIPPEPVFARIALDQLEPWFEASASPDLLDARSEHGALTLVFGEREMTGSKIETTCTLHDPRSAHCAPHDDQARIPLETEAGARALFAVHDKEAFNEGKQDIVDDANHTVASANELIWGRSFADGHVVTFGRNGELLETRSGKAEWPDFFVQSSNRASQLMGDWFLFKGLVSSREQMLAASDNRPYVLNAIRLSDGVKTKPLALTASEAPPTRNVTPRTYGRCISDVLVADLDPKLVIGTVDGGWKVHALDWPGAGRHLTCVGDAAIVTDWFPLGVQRCDTKECRAISMGDYRGDLQQELAADDKTLYAARVAGTSLLLTIVPLDHPEKRQTLPLLSLGTSGLQLEQVRSDGDGGRILHLVDGSAVIVVTARHRPDTPYELYAVSVRPDGSVSSVAADRAR